MISNSHTVELSVDDPQEETYVLVVKTIDPEKVTWRKEITFSSLAAKRAFDATRRLAQQGDYAAALERHVWFHNNALAIDPAMAGVRLSYALDEWVELGKKYPPALEKLKSIRDEKTSRLMAGEKSRDLFHDVASMNECLGDSKATVELFKRIDAAAPNLASNVYDLADDALLEAGAYELARKHMGDPGKRLAQAESNFERGTQWAKKNRAEARRAADTKANETIFTKEVVKIIAVLKETGDRDGAKRIRDKALKALDNETIRNALRP